MTHTLIYYGWYEHGFRRFHQGQDRYWRKDDPPDEPGQWVEFPDQTFDGMRFGFFQTSGGFVFVSVEDITLPQPTLFIPGRHRVAGPSPSFPRLDDDAAAAILVDMIVTNSGLRDELGAKLRALSGE